MSDLQDTPLNILKANVMDYHRKAMQWSVTETGEHDPIKFQNKIMDLVHAENRENPQYERGGYFLLPGAFESNPAEDARKQMLLLGGEGTKGTLTVPDAKEDGAFKRSYDQKINLAMENSYPAIFRVFGTQRGNDMIDQTKKFLEYTVSQIGYTGIQSLNKAIEGATKLLWGDYYLQKKGGYSNPNGIGTVYKRSKLKQYGLLDNIDALETNQFNTWYRAFNVHGKKLRFFLDPDFVGRNPTLNSSTVSAVVDEIMKNDGNIWIATINDLTLGGYRNVLMGQMGPAGADREDAMHYMNFSEFQSNPNVRVLANLYEQPEDPNAEWKPLNISEDEQMLALAEPEAYKHLDAHMDPWDQWSFFFNQTKKTVSMLGIENPWPISLLPYIPSSNFWSNAKLMMEDMGLMTPGYDMSRKRVKHYIDKFGPGSELYGSKEQQGLATNLLGFGHDFSDPKQVEMDLVWIPVWDMIQEWEARQRREGKMDEAPDAIIASLFEQRRREMFSGRVGTKEKRVFSVYDAVEFRGGQGPLYHGHLPSTYFHYNPPPGEF